MRPPADVSAPGVPGAVRGVARGGVLGVTPIVTPGRQAKAPAGSDQRSSDLRKGASQLGSREHEMSQPRQRGRRLASRLRGREPEEAERGSLTLMLIVMFAALVGLAGIVIDGGARLTAAENATSVAQEAARAGAGLVDRQTAYTSGQFVVDVPAAEAAAQSYLEAAGYTGTAGPGPTPNSIEVTVTLTRPTSLLSIIGIKDFTVNGEATANLEAGVTGPGQ
jgi:Putative Tad-like Flp pilus-assembly